MAKITGLLYLSCCFIISLYIGNVLCKVNDTCTGSNSSPCGTDSTLYVCVNDTCQCSDISYQTTEETCKKYIDPPTNVQLTDPTINSLKVTWTKPVTPDNGTYIIRLYGREDLSEPPAFPHIADQAIVKDVNVEEHVFHNLTSFWDYKASIYFIVKDKGKSKLISTEVKKTLESAPGPTVDHILHYTVKLTINVAWRCPLEKQRHGIITKYVITYEVTGSNDKTVVTKLSKDGIHCQYFVNIPVLPKTYYTVSIRADTATNEGEVYEFEPYLSYKPNKIPDVTDNLSAILLGIFGTLAGIVLLVGVFILYQRGKLPCGQPNRPVLLAES